MDIGVEGWRYNGYINLTMWHDAITNNATSCETS